MGNTGTSCQMSNHSKRNVRVFYTDTSLELDAFIACQCEGDDGSWKTMSALPADKKFSFKSNIPSIRVLASQTQEVEWVADHFLSVFVENEGDEKLCSKQIMLNMQLGAPISVLLYDV
ncbi:uncharacterized protein V6R79_022871 [Siganus canaliculatus]